MCDDSQTELCTFKVDRITNKYLSDTFYDFELKLNGIEAVLTESGDIELRLSGSDELKYIIPGDGEKKKAGHFHADGVFHEGDEH